MSWKLVLKHDENGNPTGDSPGGKAELIRMIKAGKAIRVGLRYPEDDPEERITVFQPFVVYTRYGEAFAQAAWTSSSWKAPNRDALEFESKHSEYILNVSTTGYVVRRFLFLDGKTDDHTKNLPASWFVED